MAVWLRLSIFWSSINTKMSPHQERFNRMSVVTYAEHLQDHGARIYEYAERELIELGAVNARTVHAMRFPRPPYGHCAPLVFSPNSKLRE